MFRAQENLAHQQEITIYQKSWKDFKAYKIVNRGQVLELTAQENVSL